MREAPRGECDGTKIRKLIKGMMMRKENVGICLSGMLAMLLLIGCGGSGTSKGSNGQNDGDSVEVDVSANRERALLVEPIDSATYYDAVAGKFETRYESERITNFTQVKQMLHGRVSFADSSQLVERIYFKSGAQYVRLNNPMNELLYFLAYYPEEDLLELEGEHMLRYGIDLSDGMENVGIPRLMYHSLDRRFRLSGYDAGEAGNLLYVHELTPAGRYRQIADMMYYIGDVASSSIGLLSQACWVDDQTLYIRMNEGYEEAQNNRLYYRIKMPRTKRLSPEHWRDLPEVRLPYDCSWSFDTLPKLSTLSEAHVKALGLHTLFPNGRAYQGVRLTLSPDFLSIIVPIQINDNDLVISLFNIDREGHILDDLEVGYDEVSKSSFRKRCVVHRDKLLVMQESFFDQGKIISTIRWTPEGRFITLKEEALPVR